MISCIGGCAEACPDFLAENLEGRLLCRAFSNPFFRLFSENFVSAQQAAPARSQRDGHPPTRCRAARDLLEPIWPESGRSCPALPNEARLADRTHPDTQQARSCSAGSDLTRWLGVSGAWGRRAAAAEWVAGSRPYVFPTSTPTSHHARARICFIRKTLNFCEKSGAPCRIRTHGPQD